MSQQHATNLEAAGPIRGAIVLEPDDAVRATTVLPLARNALALAVLLVLIGVWTLIDESTDGTGDRAGWLTAAFPLLMGFSVAAIFLWFPRKGVLALSDDQRVIEFSVQADVVDMADPQGNLNRLSLSSVQTAIFSSEVIVLQAESSTLFPVYLRSFDPGDRVEATRRIESGIPANAKIIRRS